MKDSDIIFWHSDFTQFIETNFIQNQAFGAGRPEGSLPYVNLKTGLKVEAGRMVSNHSSGLFCQISETTDYSLLTIDYRLLTTDY